MKKLIAILTTLALLLNGAAVLAEGAEASAPTLERAGDGELDLNELRDRLRERKGYHP